MVLVSFTTLSFKKLKHSALANMSTRSACKHQAAPRSHGSSSSGASERAVTAAVGACAQRVASRTPAGAHTHSTQGTRPTRLQVVPGVVLATLGLLVHVRQRNRALNHGLVVGNDLLARKACAWPCVCVCVCVCMFECVDALAPPHPTARPQHRQPTSAAPPPPHTHTPRTPPPHRGPLHSPLQHTCP
jgi:hypothetical protein